MNTVNVQNRVNQITTKLPSEVQQQGVTVKKNTTSMLMAFSLYSPDGTRDNDYLANYMNSHVKDVLSRVPGVGEVNTFGDTDYSMRVWLNSERLANLGLSNQEVIAAIASQNIQPAVGSGRSAVGIFFKDGGSFKYSGRIRQYCSSVGYEWWVASLKGCCRN